MSHGLGGWEKREKKARRPIYILRMMVAGMVAFIFHELTSFFLFYFSISFAVPPASSPPYSSPAAGWRGCQTMMVNPWPW